MTEPVETARSVAERRRLIAFVLVAYGSAWLVLLPLHLVPELRATLLAGALATVMMVTPTVALLISHRMVPADYRIRDRTGLVPGPARRWLGPALVGWLGMPVAVFAALALATLLGLYHPDLRDFSGYAETLAAVGSGAAAEQAGLSIGALVALTLASAPFAAIVPNAIFAFGEEFGWRGYLQPVLTRKHPVLGVVGTGVIWGLWHAPVLLLGHNFPTLHPLLRLLFMVVACILLSAVFGLLVRLAQTVWVAALAHGTLNAWAGAGAMLIAAGHADRFAYYGILGACGWVVLAIFFLIIRSVGRRTRPEQSS